MPSGLTLNAATGAITGTPRATGTSSFTVKAANTAGNTTRSLSITVASSTPQSSEAMSFSDLDKVFAKGAAVNVPAADRLKFVRALLSTELNGDAKDETIVNAVYNALFSAQFRPNNFGATDNSAYFARNGQGIHPYTFDSVIGNKIVGEKTNKKLGFSITSSAGCLSFARSRQKYITGSEGSFSASTSAGSNKSSTVLSGTQIKSLLRNAKTGENVRYYRQDGSVHSIVYLAEKRDEQGFYFLHYYGGATSKKHVIKLEYCSYASFSSGEKPVYMFYYKTPTSVAQGHKVNLLIKCPIDVIVRLGDEELNSKLNKYTASFGTMAVTENGSDKTIELTLDYSEDYEFIINGTGDGNMDLLVTYEDVNGSNTREFSSVGITTDTIINIPHLDNNNGLELYIEKSGEIEEVWYSPVNETTSEPDEALSNFNFDVYEESGYTPGKVTEGDSPINMQDVLTIYQYFRGKTTLTSEQLNAADVNEDGTVNMQDVLMVYQYFRGKITSFLP